VKVKKSNRKYYNQKGFLENLKDLGGGLVKSAAADVVKGTVQEALGQITKPKTESSSKKGNLNPDQVFDFEKYLAEKEKQIREEERRFFEQKRTQERILWTAEQQRTALQIKAIQEERKKLVNETEGLSREIKTAAVEAIVEPGIYHLDFLEKLRRLIKFIRKKVRESKTWLAEWNAYCKRKRNYYWIQVRKSGTKFMLSSERYMATQAG